MEKRKITSDTQVGTSELACVLGVAGRYVRQLAEDGVIERTGRGRFLLADSVQKYIASAKSGRTTKSGQEMEQAKLAAEVEYKEAKAKAAKLETEELEGKMHRSEDVAAMTQDLIYAVRGMLLALPGRLSVDVSAARSAAEAAEVIKKEVHSMMREISDYKYDPKKYAERVRGRRKWETDGSEIYDE